MGGRLVLGSHDNESYTAASIRHHISKHIRLILFSAVIVLLGVNLITFRSHIPSTQAVLDTLHLPNTKSTIQVALLNAHHANDEVQIALYNALSHVPRLNITRYQTTSSFGMEEVAAQLPHPPSTPWHSIEDFSQLIAQGSAPDVLVSTTCGNDYSLEADAVSALKLEYARLFEDHNTHLICVMHQSNHFIDGFGFEVKSILKPWIEARRADLVTLSPRVGQYFATEVWSLFWDDVRRQPVIRDFVPVFPVKFEESRGDDLEDVLKLAIQGSFDHGRDYQNIFLRFAELKAEWESLGLGKDAAKVQLHIVGSGERPEVPESIASQVVFHENLDYGKYYSLLHKMDVLLPAISQENWAGIDYYRNVASSSIAASIVAGVPLVADSRLMEAYSYLRLEMVWYKDEGEHEMDAAFRMLTASAEKKAALRRAISVRRAELLAEDYVNVEQWIVEAHEQAQSRLIAGVETFEVETKDVEKGSATEEERPVHRFNPFPGRPWNGGSKKKRTWR